MSRSPERYRSRDDDDEPPSPISDISPPPEAPPPPPADHHHHHPRRSAYLDDRRPDRDRDDNRAYHRDTDRPRYREREREREREPRPDDARHRRPAEYARRPSNGDTRAHHRSPSGAPVPPSSHRPREPKKQPPPQGPVRRQTITERLKSSWGGILPGNSTSRRASTSASSAAAKGNPVIKIRAWLEQCNTNHGAHCYDPAADNATFRPMWLIDCVDGKLVRSRPGDQYVALSYVWEPPGRRLPVMCMASNVPALEQKIPEDDLPQAIVDAMWLTRKLSLSLLWVDRLCIVQDDEREKDRHVRNMAYIFANAYLTIVAASGNAADRLGGLDKKPAAAKSPKPANGSHNELIAGSKWNMRAWTVEEALYMRRAVFIFEDTVTWECHCDTFQGAQSRLRMLKPGSGHKCASRLGSAHLAFQHSPWPDMDDYARVVMDYTMRRLSFVEDTPRAFAGITSVLSKVFPGGFVWGMPVMFFEVALLWQPQISIKRKTLPLDNTHLNALPSWSWMGWYFDDIPVDLLLWRAAADYVESSPPFRRGASSRRFQSQFHYRLRSIGIEWTITDRTVDTPLVPSGLQYRGKSFRRSASLPDGWSRDGYDFTHASDPNTVFRYPIPVPPTSGPEQLVVAPPPPGSFLSFTTTRGFFNVELSRNKAFKARTNPPIAVGNIYDRGGRWAGQFRSHDAWLGIQTSNHDGEEKLEFIALSEASERGGSHVFDEEVLRGVQDSDGNIDFVNVLWIERVGEVCYRRGMGHIILTVWSALAKERVPILLG